MHVTSRIDFIKIFFRAIQEMRDHVRRADFGSRKYKLRTTAEQANKGGNNKAAAAAKAGGGGKDFKSQGAKEHKTFFALLPCTSLKEFSHRKTNKQKCTLLRTNFVYAVQHKSPPSI